MLNDKVIRALLNAKTVATLTSLLEIIVEEEEEVSLTLSIIVKMLM